jgi:hypothetical protein
MGKPDLIIFQPISFTEKWVEPYFAGASPLF